jgi:hypothetical protein
MFIRLELRYLVLPIHIEDVLRLAGQALGYLGSISRRRTCGSLGVTETYVCPWARKDLRIRCMPHDGNLDQISVSVIGRKDDATKMNLARSEDVLFDRRLHEGRNLAKAARMKLNYSP